MTLPSRKSDRAVPALEASGTCVVMNDDERPCGREALLAAPWPVCAAHALAVYRFIDGQVTDQALNAPALLHAVELINIGDRGVHPTRRQLAPDVMNGWPAVVYYARSGNLIKIGTTRDLLDRMRNYPPGTRLLAVEPGAEAVERHRHAQFASLLATRAEWFRPGTELLEHIQELADTGLPRAPTPAPDRRQRSRWREAQSVETAPATPPEVVELVAPPAKPPAGDPYDPRPASCDGPARILQDDHPGL